MLHKLSLPVHAAVPGPAEGAFGAFFLIWLLLLLAQGELFNLLPPANQAQHQLLPTLPADTDSYQGHGARRTTQQHYWQLWQGSSGQSTRCVCLVFCSRAFWPLQAAML